MSETKEDYIKPKNNISEEELDKIFDIIANLLNGTRVRIFSLELEKKNKEVIKS